MPARDILVVFGTRPEAIKMCPLVLELKKRKNARVRVLATGQHREMLDQVLDAFQVTPDADMHIMREKQTLFDVTGAILSGMDAQLDVFKPDLVLVHGDTTTAFASALACFYKHIPVGHVEAGLRTYNLESPFPEEFNRQAVGLVARWHFAPTLRARDALLREGKDASHIYVTGNTAIDALHTTVRDDYHNPHLAWAADGRLILMTAHRRENLGEPMRAMFRAIRRVLDEHPDVKIIYPVHPNPIVKALAAEAFEGCDRVRLVAPLDVLDFHNFMARAHLILTDSGGIQEEAPSLGKPVLVMRDTTERPEGVDAGTLRLVGTDGAMLYTETTRLLDDPDAYAAMSHAANPYGDGRASERIADILLESDTAEQ